MDPEDSSKRRRALPIAWLGGDALHASRSLDDVLSAVRDAAEAMMTAHRHAIYAFYACNFEDHAGLYGRDVFNRSRYRRKLMRGGMMFEDRPFVNLDEAGRFTTSTGNHVVPEFVVLGGGEEDNGGVTEFMGGLVPYTFATYRFGPLEPDELTRLIEVSRSVIAFGATTPEACISFLTSRLG